MPALVWPSHLFVLFLYWNWFARDHFLLIEGGFSLCLVFLICFSFDVFNDLETGCFLIIEVTPAY